MQTDIILWGQGELEPYSIYFGCEEPPAPMWRCWQDQGVQEKVWWTQQGRVAIFSKKKKYRILSKIKIFLSMSM